MKTTAVHYKLTRNTAPSESACACIIQANYELTVKKLIIFYVCPGFFISPAAQ